MNFLRELVSQKKNRYIDDKFNLDLTYITPRIIAMSYPADGLESMYRNKIRDVAKFLDEKHKDNFLVINASNRQYDYSIFKNRVIAMKWPNHFPCPFASFVDGVLQASNHLLQDRQHVIVVHCLAGKGRTGSFVNALLYLSGLFGSIMDANTFYLCKRAVYVTYASQLRYLLYFNLFLSKEMSCMDLEPKALARLSIKTSSAKFFSDKTFVISFYDFSKNNQLLASVAVTGTSSMLIEGEQKYSCAAQIDNWKDLDSRDILVVMQSKVLVNYVRLFRANFCLFFSANTVEFRLEDIDKASPLLPDDFCLTLEFTHVKEENLTASWEKKFRDLNEGVKAIKQAFKDGHDRNGFLYG